MGRGSWKPFGTSVELTIDEIGPTGEGLATLETSRYRVSGALPGERVRARIHGRRAGFRLAETEEVLEASPFRTDDWPVAVAAAPKGKK